MNNAQMEHCTQIPGKYRGSYHKAIDEWRPLQAIRAKCLDCMNWQGAEVTDCTIDTCPLWPYRMGNKRRSAAVAHRKLSTLHLARQTT